MNTKKILLSVLAATTLVGAGTAIWQFSGDAAKKTEATVVVADAKVVGKISIDGTLTLYVDQTPTFTNSLKAIYDKEGGTGEPSGKTYTIVADDSLKNYFDFSGMSGDWSDGVVITTPSVSWKANKNPTNKDQYDTMKNALSSAKLTITFSATTINGESESIS